MGRTCIARALQALVIVEAALHSGDHSICLHCIKGNRFPKNTLGHFIFLCEKFSTLRNQASYCRAVIDHNTVPRNSYTFDDNPGLRS